MNLTCMMECALCMLPLKTCSWSLLLGKWVFNLRGRTFEESLVEEVGIIHHVGPTEEEVMSSDSIKIMSSFGPDGAVGQ